MTDSQPIASCITDKSFTYYCGGRGIFMVNMKVLPFLKPLEKQSILPFARSTTFLQILRPMPIPSVLISEEPVTPSVSSSLPKRVNSLCLPLSLIPWPLSRICTSSNCFQQSYLAKIVTGLQNENLRAFLTRLTSTCLRRIQSPQISSGNGNLCWFAQRLKSCAVKVEGWLK